MPLRPLLALALVASLLTPSCKADDTAPGPDAGAAPDGGDAGGPCTVLFGRPNASTGLGSDQCQPQCVCEGKDFVPPTYSAAFIQSLVDDWVPSKPYAPLTSDPYAKPPPADDPPGTVCAVLPQGSAGTKPRPYELVTYASQDAALAAGAKVTHFGHCGVCSTLANLAVYMKNDDLAGPVRSCGLLAGPDGGGDVPCLEQLGFDLPCAQAWAYDTANTRSLCLQICLSTTDTYNMPDGSLAPCIACDEDKSGPVFKAVAGRTRRNSGIPNAICRPCDQVQPLVHDY